MNDLWLQDRIIGAVRRYGYCEVSRNILEENIQPDEPHADVQRTRTSEATADEVRGENRRLRKEVGHDLEKRPRTSNRSIQKGDINAEVRSGPTCVTVFSETPQA